MNVNPGGKQARMHDGWFIREGLKIIQPMIFPANHPTNPNMAKGIKAVLMEHGLYKDHLRGKCKKCTSDSCCGKRILELQPDFQQQKSLVQEVIEEAGHLCILLPKFHCELNFIEFFWGAVKKYLRDNCDYTFDTLKENMPKALASVQLQTIRLVLLKLGSARLNEPEPIRAANNRSARLQSSSRAAKPPPTRGGAIYKSKASAKYNIICIN
jgi:hypothetical protein